MQTHLKLGHVPHLSNHDHISYLLQGGHRSAGWTESSPEETAKCIPVPCVVETCVS